jgi:DNA-directed RNA polymerase specialized sigma24 family protein
MSALMLKAIFRLTEIEKQKILRLREMGVRPSDIARRFGLSEGVVHKVVQAQRAITDTKVSSQRELAISPEVSADDEPHIHRA